jgi:hypothetical protein
MSCFVLGHGGANNRCNVFDKPAKLRGDEKDLREATPKGCNHTWKARMEQK